MIRCDPIDELHASLNTTLVSIGTFTNVTCHDGWKLTDTQRSQVIECKVNDTNPCQGEWTAINQCTGKIL